MSGDHEADPKFVEFLEWQLATELRRAESIGVAPKPRPKRKGTRMILTLALVGVSTLAGATGAITVVQQVDEEHKQLLVLKAQIHLEQAREQLERHITEMEEATPLFEQGYISKSEIFELRQEVGKAEAEIQRQELNLRETSKTGRPPRNDLAAPEVGGQDYVGERLTTELESARREIERRIDTYEQTKTLAERGFITTTELELDRKNVEEAEAELEIIQRRLKLRREFLDGKLSAQEVELQDMVYTATTEFESARIRLEAAARYHERVTDRFETKTISRSELREAESRVRAAEAQLRLAEVEVRIIRRQIELMEKKKGDD